MQVDSKLYCYHVNAHIFTHIDVCYTIVNKLYCNIVLIITQEQAENVGSAYADRDNSLCSVWGTVEMHM